MKFDSFTKALKAYFEIESSNMIAEYKALTEQDKVELSAMLNEVGFTHPEYQSKS